MLCVFGCVIIIFFKYFFGTRNLEQASPETFRIAPERKEGVTWFWRRGVVCRTRKTKRRFHGFSSGS